MKKDKNIFETAAKKLEKKEKIPKKEEKEEEEEPATRKDPEIEEMLEQIRAMKQDLKNKTEALKSHSGLTDENIRNFMENPKNFTPEAWEKLQKSKKVLGDKIYTVLGIELKPKEGVNIPTRENVADERKAKTLGARKKWIPMQ